MHAQIADLLVAGLGEAEGCSQPCHHRGVLAPVEALKGIRGIIERPMSEHIDSSRLAFASRKALLYPADQEAIVANQGKTVVLQHLELSGEPFESIAQSIRVATRRQSAVSCYLSTPTSDAFDWHGDEWDSVAWQLSGSKRFEFRDGREIRLAPGDLMFLPRAFVHRTSTLATSIHVSCLALPRPDDE